MENEPEVEEWHASQPVEPQVNRLVGAMRQAVAEDEPKVSLQEDIDEETRRIANEAINGLDEEEQNILKEIMDQMEMDEMPPNLRNVERKKLKSEVNKINRVLEVMSTSNITETNKLLKAAGCVVAKHLGYMKEKKKNARKEPWWKQRIKKKIKTMRKELSQLDRLKKQEIKKPQLRETIKKKYQLKNKSMDVVMEELKQRIVANSMKLKRYESRNEQYIQNRLFETNQKKLFERLEKNEVTTQEMPDKKETTEFWNGIWSQEGKHKEDAEWLKKVEEMLSGGRKQENIVISVKKLKKQLKRVQNWKAPGPDGLQGYWIKAFTACHQRIAMQLQGCLDTGEVQEWLCKGKTVLIMKDKEKGADVTNYRPITCLPIMWKVLTGVISDDMYEYLDEEKLLPQEQKGCRRNSRGTKDQLMIDKMILRNCRRRYTGLGMAWIDYQKAYDMVPHSWLRKCLEMFNIADNIRNMMDKSMDKWNTELMANGEKLGKVEIKRGIFQGDSLSPLLFVLALIPLSLVLRKERYGYRLGKDRTSINHLLFMDDLKVYGKNKDEVDGLVNTVRIFSEDIGMKFGIKKCAVLILKRGKVCSSDGILLPDQQKIKNLGDDEEYKYLGVLESDQIKHEEMKKVVTKEYFRRIRKILKSKLNAGNVVSAINSKAVSLIRYGAGILNWTKNEVRNLDRKTRKLMTTYRALHPQADVDRLYMKRENGGRGMIGIEDCVDMEMGNLKEYLENSEESMLKEVVEEGIVGSGRTKKDVLEKRGRNYKEKALHGQFYRKTEEDRDESSWDWLKRGKLKKETEGMLMAAQDQALRTNAIKSRVDKADVSPMCRLCGEREETISHVVTECKMLAQKQYKLWRHDRVACVIHWTICKQHGFNAPKYWYEHQPEMVLENEHAKILWDFPIQTDHRLDHNKPDVVLVKKEEKECFIIDVACPFDTRIKTKEAEKRDRYQDLRQEIKKLWKIKKCEVIPVIIGALGTVGKKFDSWMKKLGMEKQKHLMQQACILGTSKIIRRVLDT